MPSSPDPRPVMPSVNPAELPADPALLRAIILAMRAEQAALKEAMAALEFWNQQLRRALFGPRSEKRADPDQRDLFIEDVEVNLAEQAARVEEAQRAAKAAGAPSAQPRTKPARNIGALPASLPRETRRILPLSTACSCCGEDMHIIGEDVSERLKVIPKRYVVDQIVRPRFACRACADEVVQAPAPDNGITGGMADCSVLADIVVNKYAWHLPLYRQQQIMAGLGIEIDRSTLTRWVGTAAWWLQGLYEHLRQSIVGRDHLFCDETRLPILAPGLGHVRNGTMWAVGSDERPYGGSAPPAVFYHVGGRGLKDARQALAGFAGALQVDGYASYKALADDPTAKVDLAFCFAHARRKFHDVFKATASPAARQALETIAGLYELERRIRGGPPDKRRAARQAEAVPILNELKLWAEENLIGLSGKSPLAGAIRYLLSHWQGLTRYCGDGRLEIDSNFIERQIRPLALGRKNHLFAGSDAGARHWALFASLINTAKLNDVDPHAWLSDVLERIVTGRIKNNQLDQLMPWNWKRENQAQPQVLDAA